MTCRQCGAEIADKALICYRCGAATTDAVFRPAAPRRSNLPWLATVIIVIVIVIAVWYFSRMR